MNKYLIFIIVLLLIVVGFYFIKNVNYKGKDLSIETKDINTEPLSQSGNLKISESKVSYSVDKVFFSKPVERITGITNDISGRLNYENNLISASLVIPTLNIKTGQDKRDEDVRELLGKEIKAEVREQELILPYANKIPIFITVNGKTNEVSFYVTAKDENNVISFSGSSKISMKSFGIESPSMLDVYKASDEVELSFELKAEK